jgi:hypothetical protein
VPPAPLVEVKARPRAAMDIECYRDFFLVKFCDIATLEFAEFDAYPGKPLDIAGVCAILERVTIVTFNGNNYDVPMMAAALKGYECHALKQFSDAIIKQGLKPWDFEKQFGISPPPYLDHIDLIEVSPGVASLKMYGGKMHSRKMQDLPIDPAASISPADRVTLTAYCGNDLLVTIDLYNKFKSQIALREMLGARYGLDVRSKSDPQIAEATIKKLLQPMLPEMIRARIVRDFNVDPGPLDEARARSICKTYGMYYGIEKRFIPHGFSFCYQVPGFIQYQTAQLQALLETVRRVPFIVSDKDQVGEIDHNGEKIKTGVMMPKELADAKIKIGNSTYKLGIGGLHSTESSVYHIADAEYEISDHDVASYYPSIIINQGLYPSHLGEGCLRIYTSFREERLAEKSAGRKDNADAMKTLINGFFGKLGSKYSIFFAPELLIQTTLTGQLSLLMLIELLESHGISVISANTDGIVVKCPRRLGPTRDALIKQWETATNFETEVARYAALFSRDVNSYIAFKVPDEKDPDPKPKLKGAYAPPVPIGPSWPNPTGEVCVDAVLAYLGKGVPIEQTIRACTDVRKFAHIRTVKGGGEKWYGDEITAAVTIAGRKAQLERAGWVEVEKGIWQHAGTYARAATLDAHAAAVAALRQASPVRKEYLGKAVRWYYAVGEPGAIRYAKNGNLVAGTEGARPLMELPDTLPADVDYAHYVKAAYAILEDFGIRA